jgi:hypothetical protein
MGQGNGVAEEGNRAQPADAQAPAALGEKAVEGENHGAVDDLADVVGVAEISRRAEPSERADDLLRLLVEQALGDRLLRSGKGDIPVLMSHRQRNRDQDDAG